MWQNWGRSERARPLRVERPASVEAVQRSIEAAKRNGMTVKPIGAGHSFSGIAVATDVLMELDDLTGLIDVDRERRRVRLYAGTRQHQIP
jgi:FAD/FMN-containing dehydrogenase